MGHVGDLGIHVGGGGGYLEAFGGHLGGSWGQETFQKQKNMVKHELKSNSDVLSMPCIFGRRGGRVGHRLSGT